MQDFVHLHVHTYYSILDGQASIPKLVDKAIANGMRGMAVTDHGNMMGIKEFYNYCKKKNGKLKEEGKKPFIPIFGCEMYVARNQKSDRNKEDGDMGGYHLIVLAKNEKGYHNLIKLVSRAWTDGFYGRPRTDRKDLETYHEGLIVCSACIAGEVPHYVLQGNMEKAEEAAQWYHHLFGDDYYLELQRHEVKDPTQRANRETFPLQQKANAALLEIAKKYNIKYICSNDCHFVDEDNAEAHDRLICLSTGKDMDDPKRMLYSKQEWFKTREEMNEIFSDVPEAMATTCEILDKVETYSIDHAPIMPFFPIPESFGTEEEYRKKFTEKQLFDEFTQDENGNVVLSQEDAEKKVKKLGGYDKMYRIKFEADYLELLTMKGAKTLYGEPLGDEVKERINFELHVMKTMGFPGYFLIVQDFINAARNELGVTVGPGRGSAAGSVVAYCLGITKIDPIQYDLLFERFLNPDRISLPDIDTDFDDDGRGKVLQWVTQKYGADKVAHIITYGTMATKLAIKDVARVQKLPLETANHFAMIPLQVYNSLKVPSERKLLMGIRHLIIGGGAIDKSLENELRSFPHAVWSTYGMTETLSHIALRRLSGDNASQWYTPFPSVSISLNEDHCIVIDAPQICVRKLETNDLAELSPDGKSFRIIGRKDNIICCGGIKIQIEEIESKLRPFVHIPYIITKCKNEKFGEIVVIIIEGKNKKAQHYDSNTLMTIFDNVLPKFWIPKKIITVEKIPLTETGKPNRTRSLTIAENPL